MCKQERGDKVSKYETEPGKTCPDEIFDTLNKYNAESRPIWKPMHMQPLYKSYEFVTIEGNSRENNVGADIFQRGICLPSDNKMTLEEQDTIIEIVKSCFK